MFAAAGLPAGLSIDPATGIISGTLATGVVSPFTYDVLITAAHGNDVVHGDFYWSVLPANESDLIVLSNPGTQVSTEGTFVFLGFTHSPNDSSLSLPLQYMASGLPPGLSLEPDEATIVGTPETGGANGSPYHVAVTASDGANSATINFVWIVQPVSTIAITNPGTQFDSVGDVIDLPISLNATSGLPLTFTASGLPDGLAIDPQTGTINGTIKPLATLPGQFSVVVTASDGTTDSSASFTWKVFGLASNVVELPDPFGTGMLTISSPDGTNLTATTSANPGIAAAADVSFPFGFVTFTVSGLAPGASAQVNITPPPGTVATDYYKYGETPANSSAHWYDFLFQDQTDTDTADTTGAVIQPDGSILLNLVDGGRGDDDLSQNGVITDIGGPAIVVTGVSPLTVTTTDDDGAGSLRQAIVYANGLVGTTSTITFALAPGPQAINLLTPLPAVLNPLIVNVDAIQNVTIDASTVGDLDSLAR